MDAKIALREIRIQIQQILDTVDRVLDESPAVTLVHSKGLRRRILLLLAELPEAETIHYKKVAHEIGHDNAASVRTTIGRLVDSGHMIADRDTLGCFQLSQLGRSAVEALKRGGPEPQDPEARGRVLVAQIEKLAVEEARHSAAAARLATRALLLPTIETPSATPNAEQSTSSLGSANGTHADF